MLDLAFGYACNNFILELTLFYDNTLLPAAKVRSHSHFVYLFVIMTYFWSMIILVSIDLLVNYHVCFTLLVETHFRGLDECYGFSRTFPISDLTPMTWPPDPDLVFYRPVFHLRVTFRVFLSYFIFPFKNKTKINDDSKFFL